MSPSPLPAVSRRPRARKSPAARHGSISSSARRYITGCPSLSAARTRRRGRAIDTEFPEEIKFDQLPGEHAPRGPAAFLRCRKDATTLGAFCVVPYTRGAEFSRPSQGVVEEARRLAASGTCELTLLGQNVNAYHGEAPDGGTWSLARLIRELAGIDGLHRIRYTTSHPLDMR